MTISHFETGDQTCKDIPEVSSWNHEPDLVPYVEGGHFGKREVRIEVINDLG